MSDSTTWSHHIQLKQGNQGPKPYQMKCTKEVKGLLYSCKPILDYATVFWDPNQQYLINEIEKVQRRAARWVMGDCRYTSSVSSMISALQWPSLE